MRVLKVAKVLGHECEPVKIPQAPWHACTTYKCKTCGLLIYDRMYDLAAMFNYDRESDNRPPVWVVSGWNSRTILDEASRANPVDVTCEEVIKLTIKEIIE